MKVEIEIDKRFKVPEAIIKTDEVTDEKIKSYVSRRYISKIKKYLGI